MDKDRVQGKAKRAEGPLKEAEGTIVGVRTWRETASSRTPSVRFSPVTGFQIKHKEIKVTGMEITRTTKEKTMKKRIATIITAPGLGAGLVLSGCASAPTGTEQSAAAGRTMETVEGDIRRLVVNINRAGQALASLISPTQE